jgi:hypothetical protein
VGGDSIATVPPEGVLEAASDGVREEVDEALVESKKVLAINPPQQKRKQ